MVIVFKRLTHTRTWKTRKISAYVIIGLLMHLKWIDEHQNERKKKDEARRRQWPLTHVLLHRSKTQCLARCQTTIHTLIHTAAQRRSVVWKWYGYNRWWWWCGVRTQTTYSVTWLNVKQSIETCSDVHLQQTENDRTKEEKRVEKKWDCEFDMQNDVTHTPMTQNIGSQKISLYNGCMQMKRVTMHKSHFDLST